jgi:hypothetical protein
MVPQARHTKVRDNREGERILCVDAVLPTQASKVSSGWISKGVHSPLKSLTDAPV